MFDARNAQGEQEREGCSRHERGHERLLPRRNTAEAGGTRSSRPFQFTRNPNVAYLTIDVGGPYRSDDGCRTWRPLHGNLPYEMRLKGRSGDGGRRRDMARVFAGTSAPGAGERVWDNYGVQRGRVWASRSRATARGSTKTGRRSTRSQAISQRKEESRQGRPRGGMPLGRRNGSVRRTLWPRRP